MRVTVTATLASLLLMGAVIPTFGQRTPSAARERTSATPRGTLNREHGSTTVPSESKSIQRQIDKFDLASLGITRDELLSEYHANKALDPKLSIEKLLKLRHLARDLQLETPSVVSSAQTVKSVSDENLTGKLQGLKPGLPADEIRKMQVQAEDVVDKSKKK
jgi:hypothetical protein